MANLAAIVVSRLAPHAPLPMLSVAMLPVAMLPVAMLPVAMTGSVFRQSPYVRQVFYNALETSFPGIDVRQDLADPVEGALSRARATRM